ncbi:MAG: hypothetical protein LBB11_01110 [Puniceicoccales bacterium]|jgi:23S rRNA-/tRNA-specific pseudouridylate synthase|nr:hypothetical protein [Puniceicoccales bacterium]
MANSKLEIITQEEHYFAVNKPAHMSPIFHEAQRIYPLDRELSGIMLWAKDDATTSILRNSFGSNEIKFCFTIVAKTVPTLADEMTCNLPIARHNCNDGMLISNTTGKKSLTKFKKIEVTKQYTLWSAETYFLRCHQVRLHAYEQGIPIFGEDFYGQTPIPCFSDLKSSAKLNRKGIFVPLYPSLCIHLSQIDFPLENHRVFLQVPLPRKLDAMLKIIKKWT